MTSIVQRHIHEVLPGLDDVPAKLVQFTSALYSMSVQSRASIPKNQEVARYYVCAYLAAEKYQQQLDLPSPSLSRFPVPPRAASKLIADFRALLGSVASPNGSPARTPTRSRQNTPTKIAKQHTPKVRSPLKKLQALADRDVDAADGAEESPFLTKKPESEKTDKRAPKVRKPVGLKDIVEACNHFFVPAWVTPSLIACFNQQRIKFQTKSEWHLLCGLLYAAYTRINHRLLDNNPSALAQFQSQLFNYQRGHVVKANMLFWCSMVDGSVQHDPWIVELDKKYVYGAQGAVYNEAKEAAAKLGPDAHIIDTIGGMVNANTQLDSPAQTAYYDVWTANVLQRIR